MGGRGGMGRPTPSSNTSSLLRITDPNPLKTQPPYRGGPSPVNDHDYRHNDTRSNYNTIAHSSGAGATKSPREQYHSNNNNNNTSYHRPGLEGSASPHTKRDYVSTNYSSYGKFGSSSQQQQQHRSTSTPTHEESRKMEDNDRMITDESEMMNDLTKTDKDVPVPEPSSLPPPMVVVPPDISTTEPSGLVLAILRLADLESQMEYEYAKHEQLAFQQQLLREEYKVLAAMPIGMASYQSDYEQYLASLEPALPSQEPAATIIR